MATILPILRQRSELHVQAHQRRAGAARNGPPRCLSLHPAGTRLRRPTVPANARPRIIARPHHELCSPEAIVTQPTLLKRSATVFTLGVLLVVVCYVYVNRPVAQFFHDHRLGSQEIWRWPAIASDWLRNLAMATIPLVLLWRICKPAGRFQAVLAAISANLVVTAILKHLLKCVFGRPWPESWHPGEPSWLGSGLYGFHPFQAGGQYHSFPSGHAALTFSAISILWLAYPRWRWLWATVAVSISAALVGLNYHFVGDVIAGAMLGWLTGVCAVHWCRLEAPWTPGDAAADRLGARSGRSVSGGAR